MRLGAVRGVRNREEPLDQPRVQLPRGRLIELMMRDAVVRPRAQTLALWSGQRHASTTNCRFSIDATKPLNGSLIFTQLGWLVTLSYQRRTFGKPSKVVEPSVVHDAVHDEEARLMAFGDALAVLAADLLFAGKLDPPAIEEQMDASD
jgi:hypothetical protein